MGEKSIEERKQAEDTDKRGEDQSKGQISGFRRMGLE